MIGDFVTEDGESIVFSMRCCFEGKKYPSLVSEMGCFLLGDEDDGNGAKGGHYG